LQGLRTAKVRFLCYNVSMENPTLREIIEVEKEIQQALEQTKEKMREWIEARKKDAEEEVARSEADIRESCRRGRESAARAAAGRASSVITEAEGLADRLGLLENEKLSGIVANHIEKILPG